MDRALISSALVTLPKLTGTGSTGIRRSASVQSIDLLDQQPPFSDFNLQVAADDEAGVLQPSSPQADVGHVHSRRVRAGVADDQSPPVV
jgi:hypothetical protein